MYRKFLLIGLLAIVLVYVALYQNKNPTIQSPMLLRQSQGTIPTIQQFKQWCDTNGLNYVSNSEEFNLRYSIFSQNYQQITEYNSQKQSVKLGLNQFADLTQGEFAARHLGRVGPMISNPSVVKKFSKNVSLKSTVDWVADGAVTTVKNQGSCGSCWAFSAVGGLEGGYAITSGDLVDFSPQQLVDCSTDGNYGCNGGDLPQTFQYVVENGIEEEKSYKYKGRDGQCSYQKSKVVYTPSAYFMVTPNSPTEMATALNDQPLSVCIAASSFVFQFYDSGVLDSDSCGTQLDHCVTLTGYDDTADTPYWVIKNSWGTGWGQEGFGWIYKDMTDGSEGICGINEEPGAPTIN